MSCYKPLDAYAIYNPITGKNKIVFPKPNQKEGSADFLKSQGIEKIKVPCGQCLGCRLDYSRQWAIRCTLEAKQWEHNYFVTITYNEMHVPVNSHFVVDPVTGEVVGENKSMTLMPDDLTNFIKRLRRNFQREKGHTGVRFFACGEYGPQNVRPHYHLILFNCPLDDLILERYENGYAYYRSPFIEKAWSVLDEDGQRHQIGFVQVTDFSYETAAYTARYMLKKHKGKDSCFYEERGLYPEFTRCSRRPGLAYQYYDENKDTVYAFDQLYFTNGKGQPVKALPPKYFDRQFDIDYPDVMPYIKERRKDKAIRSSEDELSRTDLSERDYLAVKERAKAFKISKLKRSV